MILFFQILVLSDHWLNAQTEDVVLRTWEVESSHGYHKDENKKQVHTVNGLLLPTFAPKILGEKTLLWYIIRINF